MPAPTAPSRGLLETVDQRVILHGVSFADYERVLAMRGDRSAPRIAFLEGELEIMSPSRSHEGIKKNLARLLEAYAEERGLRLEGFGSWTLKSAPRERGVEPDECYILGDPGERERPDLAIEVIWTSGGLDKLEIYRGLGVREVWMWEDGRLGVHALRGEAYQPIVRSELIPDLDLEQLASAVEPFDQTASVRAYRERLRRG